MSRMDRKEKTGAGLTRKIHKMNRMKNLFADRFLLILQILNILLGFTG